MLSTDLTRNVCTLHNEADFLPTMWQQSGAKNLAGIGYKLQLTFVLKIREKCLVDPF